MNAKEFVKAWPLLTRQVKSLGIPWLDNFASAHRDPFTVLVSCIISLRTKDKVTGEASERLYALASDPAAMAHLTVKAIEKAIYPAGFYRVKAATIKKLCAVLVKHYDARVPDTIEELLKLDGVGRKTANLVVTLGYGKPGICVDIHVHRITNRWGLVSTKNPTETEYRLRETLPQKYWIALNGMLVAFGQHICKPVSPHCSRCSVSARCAKEGVARSR